MMQHATIGLHHRGSRGGGVQMRDAREERLRRLHLLRASRAGRLAAEEPDDETIERRAARLNAALDARRAR